MAVTDTFDWSRYEYRVVGMVNIDGEDCIVVGHTWQCVWGNDPELTVRGIKMHWDVTPTTHENAPMKGERLVVQRRPVGQWENM
jgi:hypothetical protein